MCGFRALITLELLSCSQMSVPTPVLLKVGTTQSKNRCPWNVTIFPVSFATAVTRFGCKSFFVLHLFFKCYLLACLHNHENLISECNHIIIL